MKKASIKMAILIPAISVLLVGIIAMVAAVGTLSSRTAKDLTNQLIEAKVNEYTNEFRVLCRDVYGAVTATTQIVANYIDPAFLENVVDARGEVIDILSEVLLSNEKITGMWTCWEPNAFDGNDRQYAGEPIYGSEGRFVPYVYQSGSSVGIEALVGYDSATEGDYYLGALRTGKPYITDPYVYVSAGKEILVCTIAVPILENGKAVGVVGADISLDSFTEVMNAAKILTDGYLFTISPSGLITTHTNEDLWLVPYNTTWMGDYTKDVDAVLASGGKFNVETYSDIVGADITFLGSGVVIGDTGRYWAICGIVPQKTVNASSTTLLLTIILIGVGLIAVAGLTIWKVVRSSLKELPVLTSAAEALAIGDISFSLEAANNGETKNELILLERAFSSMTAGIRQQAESLSKIAKGDYSLSVPIRSENDVMNQAINNMLDSTNTTLSQINQAAAQVSTGSRQIADGAQSLAQGSTEQAAAVEQLSTSISEIAEKTKANAEMALRAATLANTIKGNAEKGNSQMDQMMSAVREINQASQSINKVIKVIDDIAFQTNILALNAAVEAARAGQHGKGFAVVAEEVRNLAAKSAEAAKDTGGLIANSMEKAELGARIADETAASLVEIVSGINQSSQLVSDIARSSEEQSEGISQINKGIDQVAQVVQQNSATAEESAAASEEMSGQSEMLEQLVTQFKLRESGSGYTLPSGAKKARKQLAAAESTDSFGKY